jgi:hypothetical protein
MFILEAALVAFLATRPPAIKPPEPETAPAIATLAGPELARAIKKDLESIAGPGTVEVAIDHEILFSVRIAMQKLRPDVCTRIRQREVELSGLFPNLSFDFRFGGAELARAIKTDIESISGGGTVDVSIDSGTLFNVKVALPEFSSKLYNQIYDRALELYRLFPDLSFDFYLR